MRRSRNNGNKNTSKYVVIFIVLLAVSLIAYKSYQNKKIVKVINEDLEIASEIDDDDEIVVISSEDIIAEKETVEVDVEVEKADIEPAVSENNETTGEAVEIKKEVKNEATSQISVKNNAKSNKEVQVEPVVDDKIVVSENNADADVEVISGASDEMDEEVITPVVEEEVKTEPVFVIDSITEDVKERIVDVSWKADCPVSLDNLRYIKISYLDFENKTQVGELIVHKKVSSEIVEIFKELYNSGYQIDKMTLVANYEADDTKSMEDNNTSAFNYRPVAGSSKLSKHSYGIAIDINPIQNPYVKGDYVSPKDGRKYLDRTNVRTGMIVKNDVVYKAFKSRGWIWGGEWNTMKDYQHFQKTINLDELIK